MPGIGSISAGNPAPRGMRSSDCRRRLSRPRHLLIRSREQPTIVEAKAGALWFRKRIYMTSYDGFKFVHRAKQELDLSADAPHAFLVRAESITLPFLG